MMYATRLSEDVSHCHKEFELYLFISSRYVLGVRGLILVYSKKCEIKNTYYQK
jgi:hypothetical protein